MCIRNEEQSALGIGPIGRVSCSLDHECRAGVLVEAEETGRRGLTFNGERCIFNLVDICNVYNRIVSALLEKVEERTLNKIGRDGNARLLFEGGYSLHLASSA